MSKRPSPKKFETEFKRLQETKEEFLVTNLAYKLKSTSQKVSFELRQYPNVKCIERPTGKSVGNNYVRYQFV